MPSVLIDLRPDPTRPDELNRVAAMLGENVGVLVGDHIDDVTPHAPATVARAVCRAGLRVVSTLTCRDRTVDALSTQIDALVDLDVAAVHCVTGDHPAARFGLDVAADFALDSHELVALARQRGATVSVAESPAARPTAARPQRLGSKARAGASVAILNHGGSPDGLVRFADRCADDDIDIDLVAPVPVITDRRSAEALTQFPGVVLPDGLVDGIVESDDPQRAGIDAAVAIGAELLDSGRFVGLNLSGLGTGSDLIERVQVMSTVAEGLAS